MSEVKIMRLVTGEDVIGKVEHQDADNIKINKAFVIIPTQSAPGKPVQLMLTPYMPYTNSDTITLSVNKIVTKVDPKKEILQSYQQNTSRILTPSADLITETNIPRLDK